MTPPNKQSVKEWLTPALLAVIAGLVAIGGEAIIQAVQNQSEATSGLRSDFQRWQVQMEQRMTRLETVAGLSPSVQQEQPPTPIYRITAPTVSSGSQQRRTTSAR